MGFVVWFLYGSYFEWFFHKHLFHSPKWIKRTFNSHTMTHHQIYKGDHTYTLAEDKEPEHVRMDWWALLAFLAFHFPLIGVVQLLTGWHCLWGGMLAIASYYAIYEYFHWCMHVPNQRPFEKWSVYRFIREHHRVHHVHMLKNLNVILPLADLTLGTYKKDTKKIVVPYTRSEANSQTVTLRSVKSAPAKANATEPNAAKSPSISVKPVPAKGKAR